MAPGSFNAGEPSGKKRGRSPSPGAGKSGRAGYTETDSPQSPLKRCRPSSPSEAISPYHNQRRNITRHQYRKTGSSHISSMPDHGRLPGRRSRLVRFGDNFTPPTDAIIEPELSPLDNEVPEVMDATGPLNSNATELLNFDAFKSPKSNATKSLKPDATKLLKADKAKPLKSYSIEGDTSCVTELQHPDTRDIYRTRRSNRITNVFLQGMQAVLQQVLPDDGLDLMLKDGDLNEKFTFNGVGYCLNLRASGN